MGAADEGVGPATRAAVRLPSLDVAKARRVLGALAADGSWLSARALAVGLGALGVEEVFVGAMVHEVCGYVGQSTEGEEDEQLVELEEYLAFVFVLQVATVGSHCSFALSHCYTNQHHLRTCP